MSLYGMQRLLAHLCTSTDLLNAYRRDPDEVLAAYDLTPAQRQHVLSASTFRLGAYSRMLQGKRLSHIAATMPLTWKLVQPHISALVDRYCQEYTPTPDHENPVFREATAFHAFLCRLIDQEGRLGDVPCLREMAEYELAKLQISFSTAIAEAMPAFCAEMQAIGPEDAAAHLDTLVPLAGPHWTLLQVDCDLAEAIVRLERDGRLDAAPEGECQLLLLKRLDTFAVRSVKVSPLVAHVLLCCDGVNTAGQILSDVAGTNVELAAACRTALLELHMGEVIALIPSGGVP